MDSKTIYQTLLKKCPQQDKNIHYLRRYVNFIFACIEKNKDLPEDHYTEKHHILPKSLWPEFSDFKEHSWNCSILRARQHFIVHWMLAKSLSKNMWYAFKMMCMIKMKHRDYKITSIVYEIAKTNQAIEMSNRNISTETRQKMSISAKSRGFSDEWRQKRSDNTSGENNPCYGLFGENHPAFGYKHTEEAKLKISMAHKNKVVSDETKIKMSIAHKGENHHLWGKSRSDETKRRISESNKGKVISEEHKRKISMTKRSAPKIECEHCGKKSNKGNYKRWHGDNCKNKN